MKAMHFKICSFLLVAFLISSSTLYAGDKEKVKEKISQLNKKMATEMVEGNGEAMLDYYTEDAISMPNHAKMNRGISEIKAHYEEEKDQMPKFTDVNFETVEVYGQDDLFVEVGNYSITMEMKNMDQPYTDKGKYMTVWKMTDDGNLKIQADTWNTNTSYEEMMQMAGEMQQQMNDDEMTGGKEDEMTGGKEDEEK